MPQASKTNRDRNGWIGTFLNFSRDSRRAACVILPCSSAAGGRPARPNRILALCALCFVLKNTIVRPDLHAPRSFRYSPPMLDFHAAQMGHIYHETSVACRAPGPNGNTKRCLG